MNFTFTIKRPKDGEWGILQKNGSWTGMVGMLARQEIDFGTLISKSFRNPIKQDLKAVRLIPGYSGCTYYKKHTLISGDIGSTLGCSTYMSSSFWLLGVESREFSHAEKKRTACKAEQIHNMTIIFAQMVLGCRFE